ncbi:hypothetical protein N474_11475 [Pseudoalteromonas luteoviolacea CPMOR-2]|nr:hypothetical protein N474_11475 [Pseudoalteromonas luteoviolacea CPMOR-2]
MFAYILKISFDSQSLFDIIATNEQLSNDPFWRPECQIIAYLCLFCVTALNRTLNIILTYPTRCAVLSIKALIYWTANKAQIVVNKSSTS